MKCPLLGGLHRLNRSSSGVEGAGQSLSGMDTEGQEETTKESRTQVGKTQGEHLRLGEPSAEPWDPEKEFRFWALPPEKAACEDSLGFVSTPSFFFWGNQLGKVKWPVSNHAWDVGDKGCDLTPLANSLLRESVSFFLTHFLFVCSLWFEMRMSSVRTSKTWPVLGRVSVHLYGLQASS